MKRLLLLVTIVLLASGCASIRGERIETGLGADPVANSVVEPRERTDALESFPVATVTSDPVVLGSDDASASFDFVATELYSGGRIEGGDLFGQGSVLVTFVQPGCDISADGGSTIAQAAEAHPEANYVIVHSGADNDAYIQFAEDAELYQENMVHLSDHYGALANRYGVQDYPTTLLIDSDLRISSVVGAMDADAQLEAVVTVVKSGV